MAQETLRGESYDSDRPFAESDAELGTALKRLRGSRSLRELARTSGITRSALRGYEAGRSMPVEVAGRLDDALRAHGWVKGSVTRLRRPVTDSRLQALAKTLNYEWRAGRAGAAAGFAVAVFGLLGVSGLEALSAAALAAGAGALYPPRAQLRMRTLSLLFAGLLFVLSMSYGIYSTLGEAHQSQQTPVADPSSQGTQKNRSPNGPLANVFWIKYGTDLDCTDIGLGVELIGAQYVDVTGDSLPDAFVTYACRVGTSSAPQQLEVFDGASDPEGEPRRIGTLIRTTDGEDERGLRIRRLLFDKNVVTVDAAAFGSETPNCCPNLRVKQSFTWNGQSFVAGQRELSPLG